MRYILITLITLSLLWALIPSVSAEDLAVPAAPTAAQGYLPDSEDDFGAGLISMLQKVVPETYTHFREAVKTGLAIFCCAFLIAILQSIGCSGSVTEISGAACIAGLILQDSRSLISLAMTTVTEISEYSKLFLPVLTAAASARGALTSSASLYVGTTAVTALLTNILKRLMIPAVYLFLAASIANCAIGEESLGKMRDSIKKLSGWFMKMTLTVFLSYMTITGAVTGTADKATLKAAKAAISTVVPVIGKNLADASEVLLLSADIAKNSIGVYGIFVFLGISLSPFFRIGSNYLVLKGTAALCSIVGCKRLTKLVDDFCAAMGILLGMTGVMCALSIIGTVCFMKGVS